VRRKKRSEGVDVNGGRMGCYRFGVPRAIEKREKVTHQSLGNKPNPTKNNGLFERFMKESRKGKLHQREDCFPGGALKEKG